MYLALGVQIMMSFLVLCDTISMDGTRVVGKISWKDREVGKFSEKCLRSWKDSLAVGKMSSQLERLLGSWKDGFAVGNMSVSVGKMSLSVGKMSLSVGKVDL